MRSRSILLLLFVFLTMFSMRLYATVLIMDEHVEMQSSLTVLGNTYLSSYNESLQDLTSPLMTQSYIGILHEYDENGNDQFAGLTQDPQAANTAAYMGSRASLSWDLGNYTYWLQSIKGQFGFPDSPEAYEAYHHSVLDDFVEVTVRFRVDGFGGVSIGSCYTSRGDCLVEHHLYDHTAGVGMNLDGGQVLEDGHVYTMRSRGWNYMVDDSFHVLGGFHFYDSIVVMAEPSIDLLWLVSLSCLFLVRKSTWMRERFARSDRS
jgi:hypothetical protein